MVVIRPSTWLVLLTTYLLTSSNAHAVQVEITAGEIDYPAGTTLVSFLAPKGLDPTRRNVVLMSEEGERVIAQRDVSSLSLLYWLLERPLAAGESRVYEITSEIVDASAMPLVKCHSKDDDYEFSIGGKPVLLYNAGVKACPVEGFEACRRSGFIHPVYAPDGAKVSDDFPPEHPHQHGIMCAWVDAEFQGKTVDFWNSMKNQGIIEHSRVNGSVNGPVFGLLDVTLKHSQILDEGVKQPVLDELWFIRVYHSADPYMIDVQSMMTCKTDKPLHLKKYHYGGMAFRGAREWSFGKAEFLTSEGKDRETGNHTRPLWTAITGQVGESNYTVCGVELSTNFRYPQPVRLHPDMPYFCWSPTVLGEFDITPEKPYVSHYRFFVFDGSPDKEELDELQVATVAPLMGKLVE
jgi:hypothetical protein